MDLSTDIVIVFAVLIFVAFIVFMMRWTVRSGAGLWKDISERVRRRRFGSQLLRRLGNESRQEAEEVALAVALSPYHLPVRTSEDDEGLLQTRERYLHSFGSMSDSELKQWTQSKIIGTHSFFLAIAIESLNAAPKNRQ